MTDPKVPTRGLYRTTVPLQGKEQAVAAQRLVLFHETSAQGKPIVLLPNGVVDNRWSFHKAGYLVDDATWLRTLVPLPNMGFYTLKQTLNVGPGVDLPPGLLVQLSYTQGGEPVIFPGQLMPGNRIQFPSNGSRVTDLQLRLLEEVTFKVLAPPPTPEGQGGATPDGETAGGADEGAGNGGASASRTGLH